MLGKALRYCILGLALPVCVVISGCEPSGNNKSKRMRSEQIPGEFTSNLLVNPGFEQGRKGWSYPDTSPHWGDFKITSSLARSGDQAVRLRLHHGVDDAYQSVKVFGVMQEHQPERFPDILSGWYRVEQWQKDREMTDLYLQAVVMVSGDPRTVALTSPNNPHRDITNYQIRYYLAGLSKPAFRLLNARLKFIRRGMPEMGVWTYFETPIKADFEEHWGVVPERYDKLRVLFEARWDNLPSGGTVRADVYFDDLFLGNRASSQTTIK